MRIELVFMAITAFFITNIYTEGKLLVKALSYKKYYQMAGVVAVAAILYWLIKKNPSKAKSILKASNSYVKYLPMDKGTSAVLLPMMDFTSSVTENFGDAIENAYQPLSAALHRPELSGSGRIKRSVSESRKKYVASKQNWKCGQCQHLLSASFEIDHVIRLDRGGTNEVDNLVALCRECHGEKTILENL